MGRNIHLDIVKNGEYIAKNIFNGRNQAWFDDLQGEGWHEEYDNLPAIYGYSDQVPADYKEKYNKDNFYYGFYHMKVSLFKAWFFAYRPDKDAAWVNTYDKWRIENKNYVPEDPKHYLDKDDDIRDMHFIEFEDEYNCSRWLYNYLEDNDIPLTADIVYCFDS